MSFPAKFDTIPATQLWEPPVSMGHLKKMDQSKSITVNSS